MKIVEIKELAIPEIKVIRFARFGDHRGYFTEQFRKSDLFKSAGIKSLEPVEVLQANESFSKKNVVRGLHFQWNPYMGKLVRTIQGHMVDIVLDIREGSPHYGKVILYDMPTSNDRDFDEWIWVPPGFAHGNFFLADSKIEYLCSGEYSPNCESGISPAASDLDWGLCAGDLKSQFDEIMSNAIITDKDKDAQDLATWSESADSENFIYSDLRRSGLNE